ncbi:hypothetical protein N7532_006375 [Penicillium argentinense]|uniref:DUF7907 domain-containing protein n=1 Tax=Penicillium argentinense TaxID=1131581 RepID=A0A9W9KAP3_9EURO|nr:uncharacterized protein N7532_006375 [Penicillium argentinense]KAJ5099374.1 hypothetical protein N7532_006375 [Penicillium argentinense]
MKFLSTLALLVATATATPVARSTKEFHLKTSGAQNEAHNDLYLQTYHTGAGLNDAVFTKGSDKASPVYFNGTQALVDLQSEFPWGIVATGDTNYAGKYHGSRPDLEMYALITFDGLAWEPVEINAGGGSNGFAIKEGKFVWSEQNGFGGWLACDWYHGVPQLFYLNRFYNATIPSNCDKVDLKPVAV